MQYEGPGVEVLLSPSEDGDAHALLRLRQRFSGLARCLGLMLRCVSECEGSKGLEQERLRWSVVFMMKKELEVGCGVALGNLR